jgi:NCAIR mutase (PurE)-related protein
MDIELGFSISISIYRFNNLSYGYRYIHRYIYLIKVKMSRYLLSIVVFGCHGSLETAIAGLLYLRAFDS